MSNYDEFELDVQSTNVNESEDEVMRVTYTAATCPTLRESFCICH